jgi:acetamidase/formamidase
LSPLKAPRATPGRACVAALIAAGLAASPAGAAPKATKPVKVRSTPQNVVYGGFPIDRPAISTGRSGQVVSIDTLSSVGITVPDVSPVQYFGRLGVKASDVLPDATAFWRSLPTRTKYAGVHTLTGPVDVAGAEPGDTLEIEVLDLRTRVPYGVNLTAPDSGVFSTTYPGFRPGDAPLRIPTAPADAIAGLSPDVRQHLLRTGRSKRPATKGDEVVFFGKGVEVPLHKFMGVMAVKPADGAYVGYTPTAGPYPDGVQSSVPPGPYGGNLDVRDLTIGSKLYLPVFQKGAGFYTGDSHSVQGDGEVSGTANEQSLVGTFRFTVHKRRSTGPYAEDAKHWMVMGIDHDLGRALKLAVRRTVKWLVDHKRMTEAKAYSFASIAVDYTISEAVDRTQVVTGRIPKDVFFRDGRVKAGTLSRKATRAKASVRIDRHGHGR